MFSHNQKVGDLSTSELIPWLIYGAGVALESKLCGHMYKNINTYPLVGPLECMWYNIITAKSNDRWNMVYASFFAVCK